MYFHFPSSLVATALLLSTPALAADTVCVGPSSQTGGITVDFCDSATVDTGYTGFVTSGTPCGDGTCLGGDPPSGLESNISVSNLITDPRANSGAITNGTLYVWLECGGNGTNRVRCSLNSNLNIVSFTPFNGFVNSGTASELDLTTPCTTGPVMMGVLTVENAVSVQSESWGRVKSEY